MTTTAPDHERHDERSDAATSPRRGGIGRWIKRLVWTALAVAFLGGGWAYWLLKSEPAYVTRTEAMLATKSRSELEQIAQSLQNRVISELSRIGLPSSHPADAPVADAAPAAGESHETPTNGLRQRVTAAASDEEGVITVTLDELNAWMAVELNDWLANQNIELPQEVTRPIVAIDNGTLVLAFRYVSENIEQLVSLDFDVELADEGTAKLKLLAVRGGKLPLPAGVASKVMANPDENGPIEKLAQAFDGKQFDPIMHVDSRTFRAVGLKLRPDAIDVTVRAEVKQAHRLR